MSRQFTHQFTITADETDWMLEMPLASLVDTIINTATGHANELGIGFASLSLKNASWVLSRLAIDLRETPRFGHTYRLHTWVTSLNRLYSERAFELTELTADGNERNIGWMSSVWMAIDLDTRRPVDLTATLDVSPSDMWPDRNFGGSGCGRLQPLAGADATQTRRVMVSDIDVNRHLTTTRYIQMLVDLWPIEHYEEYRTARFEIAFKHEIRYGATAEASRLADRAMIAAEGSPCALASFSFEDRKTLTQQ